MEDNIWYGVIDSNDLIIFSANDDAGAATRLDYAETAFPDRGPFRIVELREGKEI